MRQIAWRMFLEDFSLENFLNVGSNPILKEFEKYFNDFMSFERGVSDF